MFFRVSCVCLLVACNVGPEPEAFLPETEADVGVAEASLTRSPIPWAALTQMALPPGTAHQGTPLGVPLGYDWQSVSVQHAGNSIPPGFTAVTGWGQVFWDAKAPLVLDQAISIRNAATFLCSWQTGAAAPSWFRIQRGTIEGGAYSPDYIDNSSIPATIVAEGPSTVRVSFARQPPRAFHFWPLGRSGLISTPGSRYCGLLFAFEARAVTQAGDPLKESLLLAGGGADYWLSKTAPWDNYTTNAGLGTGQLRRVGTTWGWHGYTTTSANHLWYLANRGFRDLAL